MRSKSPEKRGRQKVVPPPTYRIENEYNPEATPQCFQISINILEGRNFAWSDTQSANSYVVLVLGKKKYNTSIRRNMLELYYKESFIFEIFTSIRDIWKSSIWVAVMEPKCCTPPRILGEVNIDLGAVWLQPNHQIRNKWAQLSSPRPLTPGPVGFLKVDLSIIRRGEVIAGSSIMNDHRSQSNLLLPLSCEQQCAKYVITVYGAFGLPNCGYNEKRLRKPPSTFVTVSFCDIMAKTTIKYRTNNPQYCEKISITEMFPNICQTIKFEICFNDGCFNRVLTSAQLNLTYISHQGENGFLPTFGPSLLYMYGMLQSRTSQLQDCDDGPYFCGSLFITLKTIVPYYEQPIERVSIDPVAYINPENLWQLEDFCIICPILEVSLLNHDIVGNYCGIAITVGDIWIDNDSGDEFSNIITKARIQKLHYTGNIEVSKNESEFGYLDFNNTYPILQFPIKLIDLRFKFYRNNVIYSIVHNLELVALSVEKELKYIDPNCLDKLIDQLNIALDCASEKMEKFLDIVQCSGPIADEGDIIRQCFTELDQKQLSLQKEEISKIYQKICNRKTTKKTSINSRKLVKLLLADTQNLSHDLKGLICKNVADWPNITVWLLNQGSRVAYGKIKTSDIIHSSIPDQNGKDCGRVQSIYMKPLKCSKHANIASCYCYSCKVELLLWMGLYQQQSVFHYNINEILPGYKLKVKENVMDIKCTAMIVECRAFIYKAKLRNILNELASLKTFIRVNALNTAKETKVKSETLTPTWNQVLKIQRMAYMTPGRLVNNPPIVLVEVYSTELSNNIELIGRSQITPMVSENEDYDHAPTLQWYNLYRGVEYTGQVLMSVQILQVPEKLVKKITYSPVAESFTADEPKALQYFNSIEPLPKNLLPLSTSYKVDVYWWGLRNVGIAQKPGVMLEIDDLNFKSDIIYDKELNSNFPNGKASHTFEAPLDGPYCPLLRITLFDSGTFGRTSYLGINTTKNPNKYIVNWWPKNERDASLNRASIVSTEFVQTNPNLFVKISGEKLKEKNNYGSNATIRSSFSNLKTKRTKWRDLFWKKEPDEEEYTLLPIFVSEKHDNQNKLLHKNSLNEEQIDWWQKYLLSQSDSDDNSIENKLIIYDSELEKQPEFSKFRDWCSALKLYNGKKTGIPEKDEQIYRGILKAGIAIYRWPPHYSMVAVTSSGLDLNKGYFNNHPNNDPLKFIIRVYIVKGIHLKTKGFAGKSNPYVILNCGGKHLGDRNNYLPNTFNPIFGKMYEFRCCLPADYLLEISLYDYGTTDELIGSTSIDLEDRIYTKHRARVGLPFEYSRKGPFKWRDCMKPSEILEELCVKNHLPAPIYTNNTITVNGVIYKDNEQDKSPMSASERKENLCLSILRKWHTLPICGCHLVTEHVETRALYDAGKPGVEQGKLQMWVDIMPLDIDAYIPPPVDITPKKIEDYELRVVIYTVRNIMKGYSSSVTSNIYIRAWLGSIKQSQISDVLYNCKGEANFNWRMKFNFQYQPAIQKIIYIEKGTFTEYEENIHPMLVVQLMDYEATPPYDCFGLIKLNLTAMSRGANKINECSIHVLNSPLKLNLFSIRNFSSWWPLRSMNMDLSETTQLAGKIYMELSLLSQEKAILMPFTLGRDSSLPLPKPIRSEKSTRGLINKIRRIFHINYCYSVVLILCFIVAFSLVVVTVYRKWSRTMTFPTHYHGI